MRCMCEVPAITLKNVRCLSKNYFSSLFPNYRTRKVKSEAAEDKLLRKTCK